MEGKEKLNYRPQLKSESGQKNKEQRKLKKMLFLYDKQKR